MLSRNVTIDSVIRNQNLSTNIIEGTTSVDQETVYVYRDSTNPSLSMMVVSGMPFKIPFYESGNNDVEKLDEETNNAIELVMHFFDNIGEESTMSGVQVAFSFL